MPQADSQKEFTFVKKHACSLAAVALALALSFLSCGGGGNIFDNSVLVYEE